MLVQRYEALLEEKKRRNQALGIQDEFPLSSDFSSINTKDTDDEKAQQQHKQAKETSTTAQNAAKADRAKTMTTTRTPTDFSEVSSGFSDETSNKATQTDGRAAAGSFLCTITDGEDCKFSIYDEDSTSIDSRFRNRPEYRELFKEIFQILKKAAENREEGDKLPLLDDEDKANQLAQAQHQQAMGVPPVTPATEELPYMMDNSDAQSIASSMMSETSVAMSECITKTERKKKKKKMVEKQIQQQQEQQVAAAMPEDSRILANKRDQLEYLSVAVKVKKRDRKNRYRTPFPDYPQAGLPTPPRFFYGNGRKRREFNPFETPFGPVPQQSAAAAPKPAGGSPVDGEWSGDSMTIYNRNMQAQNSAALDATTPTNAPPGGFGDAANEMTFRPSTASQEIQRLKKLELTYAEVLRRADEQSKQQAWNKQQTNVPMQAHHQQQPQQSQAQAQNQYHGGQNSFNNGSRQQQRHSGGGGGQKEARRFHNNTNQQRK